MQTITDSKARALTNRDDVIQLLVRGRDILKQVAINELSFRRTRVQIMFGGWLLGGVLTQLKERVGHGDWEKWLPANFVELGRSEGTRLNNAKRCMKLWKENQTPKLRRLANAQIDQIPYDSAALFSRDSERKFMWSYIPEKERPKLEDPKFSRSVSFLNIVNEYNRLKQRHVNGLHLVDFDEAREETLELHQFLDWLHGDSNENPWEN